MSDYKRRNWRHDRDWHYTDEELRIEEARQQVARENEAAMVVRGLVFNEDDYPPVASPQDEQERQW